MNFAWFKQFLPRGLYGRAALILLVPVIAIQLVVSVAFIQRHFERVTRQMTESMLREVDLVVSRVESADSLAAARSVVADLAEPLGLSVALPDYAGQGMGGDRRRVQDLTGIVVIDTIRLNLRQIRGIDLSDGAVVTLYLDTRWGPMRVVFPRDWVSASNPHQLLVIMVAVSILMTVISYIFLRNQLRPIHRMAEAAEAFGKGHSVPYHPSGASEVRTAGRAFLDMRSRIERQIEQRTLMLSGISHDLRTPLTRLRLGLSMLPDDPETRDDISAMEKDVAEMAKMIDAFLEFSRMGAVMADPEPVDPLELVRAVVGDQRRMGRQVTLVNCPEECPDLMLRPDAIRRALENLIGNAVRYGRRAEVSVQLTARSLRIAVEDDGPGIRPERREEALRPFTRLDPARNQDRGQGVGLGLAIAADIVRRHGGELKLGTSARLGGLSAELVLPR
ncbi:ATP-binding protein [Paenirhodobacter enshiensis]|uniref:histidine kinase n=1 Tax=Paenirhodobacter enshiensis TaxID=1105367 RepID=A0A086Y1H5_9RHOB|nr:ATP-binding protein [Paenirhodobacter enshiensis]KFI28125.1 histidine kinase [Paenirhodobacter enshiensis]